MRFEISEQLYRLLTLVLLALILLTLLFRSNGPRYISGGRGMVVDTKTGETWYGPPGRGHLIGAPEPSRSGEPPEPPKPTM